MVEVLQRRALAERADVVPLQLRVVVLEAFGKLRSADGLKTKEIFLANTEFDDFKRRREWLTVKVGAANVRDHV